MAGFDQPGYIQQDDSVGEGLISKIKGGLSNANAAPDSRLVMANLQVKQQPTALGVEFRNANRGYVQEGGAHGPSVIATAVTGILGDLMAPGYTLQRSSGHTLIDVISEANMPPGVTEGMQLSESVRQARVKANAELKAKEKIGAAVRSFEVRQAKTNARHQAHVERATEKGYAAGQKDNVKADGREQTFNTVVGTIASKTGNVAKGVAYKAADFRDNTVFVGKIVRGFLKRKFGEVKSTIDGKFSD